MAEAVTSLFGGHMQRSLIHHFRMSSIHVRRDKAALFQWVQGPPGDSLPPEATGAGMEETKCLKPSDSGSRIGDRREGAGRNASKRRANLEKDDVQADTIVESGKADTAG